MDKQHILDRCATELTEREAYGIAETRFWESDEWTPTELALMQLNQRRLVMDFSVFHQSVENLLERPVWTHEFINPDAMLNEYETKIKPTIEEIMDPLDIGVVVVT